MGRFEIRREPTEDVFPRYFEEEMVFVDVNIYSMYCLSLSTIDAASPSLLLLALSLSAATPSPSISDSVAATQAKRSSTLSCLDRVWGPDLGGGRLQ